MSLLNGDKELPSDGYCRTSNIVDWKWRAQRQPNSNEGKNSNQIPQTVIHIMFLFYKTLKVINVWNLFVIKNTITQFSLRVSKMSIGKKWTKITKVLTSHVGLGMLSLLVSRFWEVQSGNAMGAMNINFWVLIPLTYARKVSYSPIFCDVM